MQGKGQLHLTVRRSSSANTPCGCRKRPSALDSTSVAHESLIRIEPVLYRLQAVEDCSSNLYPGRTAAKRLPPVNGSWTHTKLLCKLSSAEVAIENELVGGRFRNGGRGRGRWSNKYSGLSCH